MPKTSLLPPPSMFALARRPVIWVVPALFFIILLQRATRSTAPNNHILSLASTRLQSLQKSYKAAWDEEDWGLRLGTTDLEAYTREMRKAWIDIFGHDTDQLGDAPLLGRPQHPVPFDAVLARLKLDTIPGRDKQIPHRVYTTSSVPREEYPPQFRYWAENDPSLSFRHLNDTIMNEYLSAIYPRGSDPSPSPMSQLRSSLPKMVLKADLLRYTVLLHKGGIYTDTDTAAVRPFDDWGTTGTLDMTDHVISSLPLFLTGDVRLADSTPPPAVIVAIEMNGAEAAWRDKKLVRGLQIVQWTMAAAPGHPIFLDVIHRILQKWRDANAAKEDLKALDPLEWTGPGPFTDAVLRYAMARYGVSPRRFLSLEKPARIGDLLVLPYRAFNTDASEGEQPEQGCVWHGFSGSWRDEDEDEDE